LGEGRTITLDESGIGLLAQEAGIEISKLADGQVSYGPLAEPGDESTAVTYNTIRIPKGGQYRLVLPDGTKVHLNSASTLEYPTRFTGTSREVKLTGEAYFEVKPQLSENSQPAMPTSRIPFIVKTATQQVEVFGTVFNINAYNEQATKTTLVEGSVRVAANTTQAVMLQPGEVATCTAGQTGLMVEQADLDEDLAWHNGYFIFNDEDIRSIMERVARWYDVEVAYEGRMEDKRFGGVFQRSKSITQLLENFRTTGLVDFKITERRITVMAK
jgi:transmembrane sensor